MNYKYLVTNVGKIVFAEGLLLLCPVAIALIYGEQIWKSYLLIALICLVIGGLSFLIKNHKKIYAKESLCAVALSWIALSLIGAIPPFISGEISSYIDSLFDIISGFTTTGATSLTTVETLSYATHFWRCFSHFIGGMGILVFVLAILPEQDKQSMHIMRAEMPGPSVGKLVSKAKLTARILYGIYIGINALEVIFLRFGGMKLFDAITTAMSTTGTGGFALHNSSIAYYNSVYIEIVITVFMILSATNFNLFYFLIIGEFKSILKNEEFRWYLGIVSFSIIAIAFNIWSTCESLAEAFRYSSFQVASVISTTGFSTVNFDLWPTFSKVILVFLMFIGACAGSTGGGIKVIRVVISAKSCIANLKKQIFPRSVSPVKFEGRIVDDNVLNGINTFSLAFIFIYAISVLIVSFDPIDFTSAATSVVACISNIGPGLGIVGPAGNFSSLSNLSKIVLMVDMLIGRLEIFPMLILFVPGAWRKKV